MSFWWSTWFTNKNSRSCYGNIIIEILQMVNIISTFGYHYTYITNNIAEIESSVYDFAPTTTEIFILIECYWNFTFITLISNFCQIFDDISTKKKRWRCSADTHTLCTHSSRWQRFVCDGKDSYVMTMIIGYHKWK